MRGNMKGKFSVSKILSTFSLPIILIFLFILFSALLPDTFPTVFNIRSIINTQAPIVLLALAVLVPIAAGHFDLSVGYMVGLMHILAVGLQTRAHIPWPLVVILLVGLGILIGVINGLLVTRVKIDSFIATLGTGTIIYGLAFWYTNGEQVLGNTLSKSFLFLSSSVGGIPVMAIIVMAIAVVLWIFLEYTPVGRYMYMLGSSAKASELAGISPNKYLLVAFASSGALTAVAGILLASMLRVGQISVGPNYLMQSFAGALLGATTIKVGRVNVWGTVCAVMMLAIAVAGLQQMGARYFVEPIFNGSILLVAVAFQMYTARRRMEANKKQRTAAILAEEKAGE